jgi:hypothetical protein
LCGCQELEKDLITAVNGSIPSSRNPYPNVGVLFIQWEHDDLGVDKEIVLLEKVFQDKFHFTSISHFKIPGNFKKDSKDAGKKLEIALENFKAKHQAPDLLIIYYGGHGVMQEDNRSYWAAYVS